MISPVPKTAKPKTSPLAPRRGLISMPRPALSDAQRKAMMAKTKGGRSA